MPIKPRRPCKQPGCFVLVESGYCNQHKQNYRHARPDQAEQKIYQSRRWTALSLKKRQVDPFCERCQKQGQIAQATLVHHKLPIRNGGDPWDWNNLESVCGSCQALAHRGRGV